MSYGGYVDVMGGFIQEGTFGGYVAPYLQAGECKEEVGFVLCDSSRER